MILFIKLQIAFEKIKKRLRSDLDTASASRGISTQIVSRECKTLRNKAFSPQDHGFTIDPQRELVTICIATLSNR